MNKLEVKNLAEYFGIHVPASKIKDRDVRTAIVRLYASLAKANKETLDDLEEIRKSLTKDHEEEIKKYADLLNKAADDKLTDEEKAAAKREAEGMTECVRIDNDYREASEKLFAEESTAFIAKVPLEVIYEALSDCGFPGYKAELPIMVVEQIYANVIS